MVLREEAESFRRSLLSWYKKNARDLPWRRTKDPYAVWVSEIMLQQTTVKAVIPYHERWMTAFPTLQKLAKAEQEKVLSLWEGLGYYSRARNLHKAAGLVLRDHAGVVPQRSNDLARLPGIGRYTAAAIASIAFDEKTAVLDGNVTRVLARLTDLEEDATAGPVQKRLWDEANALLAPRRPGDFNQAMMELGAVVCTPRIPNCHVCPVRRFCRARTNGTEELRPVKPRGKRLPRYSVAVGIVMDPQKRVLVRKRSEEGRWGGLWELIERRLKNTTRPEKELMKELSSLESAASPRPIRLGKQRRLTSMFTEDLTVFYVEIDPPPRLKLKKDLRWVSLKESKTVPMGAVTRRILQEFFHHAL